MHPARLFSFDLLWEGLESEHHAGFLSKKEHGNLVLYNYNQSCVYKKHWTPFTVMARGLVLVPKEKKIVALPFPKFFNYDEVGSPDFPIERATLISEKMDGSLGIIFFHEGWHVVTRGSFDSSQSQWAKQWLGQKGIFEKLQPGTTYLVEIIYPENRIVVEYNYENIILLGAYPQDGTEVTELTSLGTGLDPVVFHSFATLADIVQACATLPVTREGFVLRKPDGQRLKFKGTAYCAAHKAQIGLSPLTVWKKMCNCEDLLAFRAVLPEEFYDEYDRIVRELETALARVRQTIEELGQREANKTNKEVAQSLSLSEEEKSMVFLRRRPRYVDTLDQAGKNRTFVFNLFKPL
jgi:RNA ligase